MNRFALIIANQQYEDTGLRQLVAPAQDAEALANILKDPNIGNFEVELLVNRPSYEISKRIEEFFEDRKTDDLLVLYFSGHGIKDKRGKLYFATSDTSRKILRTTAIPANLVNDLMEDSRSRQQVLLLDCCFSGAFARTKADQEIEISEQFPGKGRVVLTSSNSIQYSFEDDNTENMSILSVFTSSLVEGLKTGDADSDGDGQISLDELYDYVYDHIASTHQRPQKFASVEGHIFIAKNPHLRKRKIGLDSSDINVLLEQIKWRRYHEGSYSNEDPLDSVKDKLYLLRSNLGETDQVIDELTTTELQLLLNATKKNIEYVNNYDYQMPPHDSEKLRNEKLTPLLSIVKKLRTIIAETAH
jgi:hypothetical protein